MFYQKSEAQNDLIYFRRVIQYFNKHLLSDWQSDSGQKAGRDNGGNYGVQRARLDTFNMTLVRSCSNSITARNVDTSQSPGGSNCGA